MFARRVSVSRGYTAPVGLLGELTITAAVFSVMALMMLPTERLKVTDLAGASTHTAPASSIHTRYSGKYGETTITSSPGLVRAWSAQHTEAAAPQVIKIFC